MKYGYYKSYNKILDKFDVTITKHKIEIFVENLKVLRLRIQRGDDVEY